MDSLDNEFPDLQFRRAEVQQYGIVKIGGMEISADLRDVFVHQRRAGFDLNDEAFFDQKAYDIFSQDGSVFVVNLHGFLLFDGETFFPQPVRQPILIHLLHMSVPKVYMQLECGLTEVVA